MLLVPDWEKIAVSILTRPGGRVQPESSGCRWPCRTVSILTRPGGRVQRIRIRHTFFLTTEFQSSPVPEDGCNACDCSGCAAFHMVSILTRPGGRVQRLN